MYVDRRDGRGREPRLLKGTEGVRDEDPNRVADPRLAANDGRVEHQEEVDGAIGDWTATLTMDEVLEVLEEARVPAGPINSVVEIMTDPHFQVRGMFEEVEVGGRPLKIPSIVPKLSEIPGRTEWAGPEIGAHNREIFEGFLGLSREEVEQLRREEVI